MPLPDQLSAPLKPLARVVVVVRMSSGEDSETAEWEREQMLRGSQSRKQKCQQMGTGGGSSDKKTAIDATVAKNQINQDIKKAQDTIESIKRSIGSTRLDLARSENKLKAMREQIEKLKSKEVTMENLDEPLA